MGHVQSSGADGGPVGGGFTWSDFEAGHGGSAGAGANGAAAEDGGGASTSWKAKRARKGGGARSEEAVTRREDELADADGAPRSADDYERLLLGAPNSSYAWLRYMSFMLSLTEIDKARQLGERALKTIELGEHKERFNIWAALLNLEKAHGDEESLASATSRALLGADPKAVHMHVASMHERANDHALADAAYEAACKKYRSHMDVWSAWVVSRMSRGDHAGAKATLQRSVDALPRAKHVDLLCKFAQLEFKHGAPERGRTVFDGILANYPKRVDVWSIYLDMELKQGEPEPTRRVLERCTSLRLSSKKMKFLFTRYLTYAREEGDAKLIAHVKEKARSWVESAAAAGGGGD